MKSVRKQQSLGERFEVAEEQLHSDRDATFDLMMTVTDPADGEVYLLRLFEKSNTTADDDLRSFISGTVRRMRRVLAGEGARDVLVEVIDVVEDDVYLGSRMSDPGVPLSLRSSRSVNKDFDSVRGTVGRSLFWRNMQLVADGLHRCHRTGVVHGRVAEASVFTMRSKEPDYRLGGYERAIGIHDESEDQISSSDSAVVSFRRDWIDFGAMIVRLLGLESSNPPNLIAAELLLLDRLRKPPTFELYDGPDIIAEIASIVVELVRSRSGGEGELIAFLTSRVIREDLAALTAGAISAIETDELFDFVRVDIEGPHTYMADPITGYQVRLVTDLAIYELRTKDGSIASVERCRLRRKDDSPTNIFAPTPRIQLQQNQKNARLRLRAKGRDVASWIPAIASTSEDWAEDPIAWHALMLQEAFTLLSEQFMIYPVDVVPLSESDVGSRIALIPRIEPALEERRKAMGLRPVSSSLSRELRSDDGRIWTLSATNTIGRLSSPFQELVYEGDDLRTGQRSYVFTVKEQLALGAKLYLRPMPDMQSRSAVRRRLRNIVAARGNLGVMAAVDDPAQIGADNRLAEIAPAGEAPQGLDISKKAAWSAISSARASTAIVGPPGVGKTYFVTVLVDRILDNDPDARILISAQGHDTLVGIEDKLRSKLGADRIIVRIGKTNDVGAAKQMRNHSTALLEAFASITNTTSHTLVDRARNYVQMLLAENDEPKLVDEMLRDTENLLLRSAHVVLASTNSFAVEEMVSEGEQFDWVVVEEAAKANGPELVGALLLGNRRVMIGDHHQLVPFGAEIREQMYTADKATVLLTDAIKRLKEVQDIPTEVEASLLYLSESPDVLVDVLAAATRFEQPFKAIVEREEDRGREDVAITLIEQSRMHPAICKLVSKVFYNDRLLTASRVLERAGVLQESHNFPSSPIVILDTPSLSRSAKKYIEIERNGSYRNEVEAKAVLAAIRRIKPVEGNGPITLAVLSPYREQLNFLRKIIKEGMTDYGDTLNGFHAARGGDKFVHTVDSFQGGEADVVIVSLVRNNSFSGTRALGFVRNRNRLNVLLSRARHKLIIATSLDFLSDAATSTDPDGEGGNGLEIIGKITDELRKTSIIDFENDLNEVSIVPVDEHGGLQT